MVAAVKTRLALTQCLLAFYRIFEAVAEDARRALLAVLPILILQVEQECRHEAVRRSHGEARLH